MATLENIHHVTCVIGRYVIRLKGIRIVKIVRIVKNCKYRKDRKDRKDFQQNAPFYTTKDFPETNEENNLDQN